MIFELAENDSPRKYVTFGDNSKGKVVGLGKVAISHDSDTSILHHAFISVFIALWVVITHYVTILMPILSYFTRFT